jgi:pyruvate dehydrogenase E1 component alpha subunit
LELFGRAAGACRGKGGSMHIFDYSVGMLGANGVVAAGLAIAAGAALATKLAGRDGVAVAFFGDGATNRGTFHESLNLAQVWSLPVLFVVEQNGYASTTPYDDTHAYRSTADFARGYGMEVARVDGNNVGAVSEAAGTLMSHARAGAGPGLLEAVTYRIKGHYIGDPEKYRTRDEVKSAQAADPIARCRARLLEGGVAETELQEIEAEERARVEAAAQAAAAAPLPEPASALTDLYAEAP